MVRYGNMSFEDALSQTASSDYADAARLMQDVFYPELIRRVGPEKGKQLWEQAILGDVNEVVDVFGGWKVFKEFARSSAMFGDEGIYQGTDKITVTPGMTVEFSGLTMRHGTDLIEILTPEGKWKRVTGAFELQKNMEVRVNYLDVHSDSLEYESDGELPALKLSVGGRSELQQLTQQITKAVRNNPAYVRLNPTLSVDELRAALAPIVEDAYKRMAESNRAGPQLNDQESVDLISSVVEKILKERIQKTLSPESLIQTKSQSIPIRAFVDSVMRAIFGAPTTMNEKEIQKKAELEALQKSAGGGVSLSQQNSNKNFLSEVL